MKDKTKQLCLWTSALYESERMSRDEIYAQLISTTSRIKEVSQCKQLVGYLLYNKFDYTMQMVVEEFKLKNHSTAVYWMDRIEHQIKTNKRMKYRYDYLLDCLAGNFKEIKRVNTEFKSKYNLSDADKDFIRLHIDKGYSITYIADVLRKTRGTIKDYIKVIDVKSSKFEARAMDRVRIHSFNKRQTIDY